jgi:glyoxylase-like metal-dependent hydrolase (beta-lactamase superfamily II)
VSAPVALDLRHQETPRTIASYVLLGDEPVLVDCGPTTALPALEAGLAAHGLAVSDLRHVVLTHIHLDHAGAAGTLVRLNPRLRVHVGEIGAPHVADPSRLERSARRLYGEAFDTLWGELAPVPAANLHVVGDRCLGMEAFRTPGHAVHHVTYLAEDGSCFSGDVTGVRIAPAAHIRPVAPPPDVDLEAWAASLDEIERRSPARLCLPHFGVFEDVGEHLARMRERLAEWAERVRAGADEAEFVAAADAELDAEVDPETAESYRVVAPAGSSQLGLRRYWDKRVEAEAEAQAGPPAS